MASNHESTNSAAKRPPSPPAPPNLLNVLHGDTETQGSVSRPKLVSLPTTAVSSEQIHITAEPDDGTTGPPLHRSVTSSSPHGLDARTSVADIQHRFNSDNRGPENSVQLRFEALDKEERSPPARPTTGDEIVRSTHTFNSHLARITSTIAADEKSNNTALGSELTDVGGESLSNPESLPQWKSERKQFLILAQAGMPIWQRHGSDQMVSGYVGAIRTIISFFENSGDSLKSFTAGDTRFVIASQGPLYLVAASQLGESEQQLRSQLDALYTQILSTLTLPNLMRIFSLQPSTDLRKPLQGTESLLASLADSFTQGSPSTLLSSLECLRLRHRHRQAINDVLLKKRCPELLYGLVVVGGRLVSVVRPKTHSLHPSDLKLIFNMLFEANGIQAGGGESWIPICLPGFNRNGFLYMYVSYLDDVADLPQPSALRATHESTELASHEEHVAVLLLSSKKDAFFELQRCRNAIVTALESQGLLDVIRRGFITARPATIDVVPDGRLSHFLYKSRGNLQFVTSTWQSSGEFRAARRHLMSIYASLHASLHARGNQLKVHYSATKVSANLAWTTDVFELYCIAEPGTSKNRLAQSANKIVQWVRKEEDRLFIIGGAVF